MYPYGDEKALQMICMLFFIWTPSAYNQLVALTEICDPSVYLIGKVYESVTSATVSFSIGRCSFTDTSVRESSIIQMDADHFMVISEEHLNYQNEAPGMAVGKLSNWVSAGFCIEHISIAYCFSTSLGMQNYERIDQHDSAS